MDARKQAHTHQQAAQQAQQALTHQQAQLASTQSSMEISHGRLGEARMAVEYANETARHCAEKAHALERQIGELHAAAEQASQAKATLEKAHASELAALKKQMAEAATPAAIVVAALDDTKALYEKEKALRAALEEEKRELAEALATAEAKVTEAEEIESSAAVDLRDIRCMMEAQLDAARQRTAEEEAEAVRAQQATERLVERERHVPRLNLELLEKNGDMEDEIESLRSQNQALQTALTQRTARESSGSGLREGAGSVVGVAGRASHRIDRLLGEMDRSTGDLRVNLHTATQNYDANASNSGAAAQRGLSRAAASNLSTYREVRRGSCYDASSSCSPRSSCRYGTKPSPRGAEAREMVGRSLGEACGGRGSGWSTAR